MKKIVVFASGSGSNFEAVVRQLDGAACEVALLVCDVSGAGCLERAERLGIDAVVVDRAKFGSRVDYESAILEQLDPIEPDLIVLAGYMRIIGPTLLKQYQGKIINIHPSLLPAFPGLDGIGDALAYGEKVIGVTVHYVDSGVDTGQIIDQAAIHLTGTETKAEVTTQIHALEHNLYPQVIRHILDVGGYVGSVE
jgi:phosphoribosylglycinamide formyltransferase-1